MNAHPTAALVASMMDPKRQPLPNKKQFQQSIPAEGRRASSFSRTTWDQWRYRHLPHRVHGLQIAKFEDTFIFCQNWKVKVKTLQPLWGIWWQLVLWLLERNPGKDILIFFLTFLSPWKFFCKKKLLLLWRFWLSFVRSRFLLLFESYPQYFFIWPHNFNCRSFLFKIEIKQNFCKNVTNTLIKMGGWRTFKNTPSSFVWLISIAM